MVQCRHCRTVVRGEMAEKEARCPRCRMPLYERPETQRRPPPSLAGLGPCQVHPHSEATGRCGRCKQFFCSICRTRWHDELLCLACLNQALEEKETIPRETQAQRRQGMWSILLALAGWFLFLLSCVLLNGMREGQGNRDQAILTLVLFLASFLPTLLGLGQAGTVIRKRGQRLVLATWSLILASLQIGITLGLVVLNITHN